MHSAARRAVALVLLLATALTIAAAQEFSLRLQGPRGAVKSDSEVHIKATILNTSNGVIGFAMGFGNNEFDYEVEIVDAHNRAPAPTPEIKHLRENPSQWWGSYASRDLKPGESFNEDLVLTHLYKLEPGEYTVQCKRGIRAHGFNDRESVKSNVIHL